MAKVWPNDQRRAEFFERLESLIADFPELQGAGERDEMTDEILDGYDPDSPKMMTGVVVLVSWHNMDNWSEQIVADPLSQSHYLTVGMLHQALGMQGG